MVVVLVELTYMPCLKRALPHRWHSVDISLIIHKTIFPNCLPILFIVAWSSSQGLIPPPPIPYSCPCLFLISPYRLSFTPYLHIHSTGERFSKLTLQPDLSVELHYLPTYLLHHSPWLHSQYLKLNVSTEKLISSFTRTLIATDEGIPIKATW